MSKCPKPSPVQFESIGTIRYRSDNVLFFVPDSSHLLKYSGSSYAVFVGSAAVKDDASPPTVKDDVRDALAVKLQTNEDSGIFLEESIPIKIGSISNDVVLVAVAKQTKVTVTVAVKDADNARTIQKKDHYLDLSRITLPAG